MRKRNILSQKTIFDTFSETSGIIHKIFSLSEKKLPQKWEFFSSESDFLHTFFTDIRNVKRVSEKYIAFSNNYI